MAKRSTPAATVAAIGRLVQETRLTLSEIAARTNVAQSTVSRLKLVHGWTRPAKTEAPGEAGRGDSPPDLADLIAECLARLKRQVASLPRSKGESFNEALRSFADTGRTLKELARVASTLGRPDPAHAALPEPPADDLDDARFDALCDELADGFLRWRARRPVALLQGKPDAPPSA